MAPCSPITLPSPTGPTGPAIPGFGPPYSPDLSALSDLIKFPNGFPEDLLYILNLLQFQLPVGLLKPYLNPNFGKDIFDGIMKLLDAFMPFLMLYKFFLPILNLIICIIEVLCAIPNPIAVITALDRLFTQCLPAFLNLFPIFALILMIISLILLLIKLIEYIIGKIIDFIVALLRNINALIMAFQESSAVGVLAIANKLGALMCIFQNLFVLLAFFEIIIQSIKDILSLVFAIPPCEGGNNSNCCGPLTCPIIVQNPYTRNTGTLQYYNEVGFVTTTQVPTSVSSDGYMHLDLRTESWQLYDPNQETYQQFINIINAYDITPIALADGYNIPIFFPTTQTFTSETSPAQAAYTVDIRVHYNPSDWGKTGPSQYIRFNNCIMLLATSPFLQNYDNSLTPIINDIGQTTGVIFIGGGTGMLDDNVTPIIDGYMPDGVTPIPATLNNFLHLPSTPSISDIPVPSALNSHTFTDVQYTFKPNTPVLLGANLITSGCMPAVAMNKAFVNNVVFANIATQTANITQLVNSPNFPNPAATQQCLTNALNTLRSNMTVAGVAEFQASANICLNTLQNDCDNALTAVIGIGFSPCNSEFTLSTDVQFTTQPITVSVNLNENNSVSIASNLPTNIGADLASQIVAYPTFGNISPFTYDGYGSFNAQLTSESTGAGSIMVAFQNQIICVNTLPTNGSAPSHILENLDYQFIYAPANIPQTGEGDTTGIQPRRDPGTDSSGSE